VNIASRLESQGLPNRIQVSQTIVAALRDRYKFESRGTISLKGKGQMPTFFLVPPESH
jgi:class 3 adenylate cyclase